MNSHFHNFRHQLQGSEIMLLCKKGSDDEALASKLMSEAQSGIDDAMRFVFEDVPQLSPIPELFRLPYPVCWFEFTEAVDENAAARMNKQPQRMRIAPSRMRVGALVLETETEFEIFGFTEAPNERWAFLVSCRIRKPMDHQYVMELFHRDSGMLGLIKNGDESWEDEYAGVLIWQLGAMLAAINCTNVRRREICPDPKLQKAREKRKKLPLYSFWTLELRTEGDRATPGNGTHASPRLHLRRGHAREYSPGKFCWVQAHAVGNKSLGVVHKDYAYRSGVAA